MTAGFSYWRTRDVRELAVYQHGVLTNEDLRGVGLPASTITSWLKGERLVRLAPRAYLIPDLFDDLDLGAVIEESLLERALESALRRRLTSLPRLRWRMGQLSRQGRPGPATLRRVLDRRPPGVPPTESELETRFVQVLRSAGVPEPVRQHPVKLPNGGTVRLDFAYPDKLLFIEANGWAAHRSRKAFVRDNRRENQVVLLGWKPLGLTWDDVVDRPEEVAAEVAAALAASGRT